MTSLVATEFLVVHREAAQLVYTKVFLLPPLLSCCRLVLDLKQIEVIEAIEAIEAIDAIL